MSGDEDSSRRVPDDITTDILSRLPVKSLLRFRAACKKWRSDIRSPHFIDAHLDRARHSRPPSLALIDPCNPRGSFTATITALDDSWNPSPILSRSYPGEKASLVGSCNGLLYVSHSAGKIAILNPAIGDSLALPEPTVRATWRFFGFHPLTNEYKVIHLFRCNSEGKVGCDVYTLDLAGGSGSWKRISDALDFHPVGGGITIRGVMYWITNPICNGDDKILDIELRECCIVCFDLGAESFAKICFPNIEIYGETDHRVASLMEIDGRLCVAVFVPTNTLLPEGSSGQIDLWMPGEDAGSEWIRKYSLSSPWEKCYTGSMLIHGGKILICSQYFSGNNLFSGKNVLRCGDLKSENENWKEIYSYRRPAGVLPHVESLVHAIN